MRDEKMPALTIATSQQPHTPVNALARIRGAVIIRRLLSAWHAPRPVLKISVLGLSLLIALVLAKGLPWTAPPFDAQSFNSNGSAFRLYYQAALDVRRGASPYGPAVAWATTHTSEDPANLAMDVYTYTPLLALLLLPWTILPLALLAAAWALLSLLCATYLSGYLARLVVPGARGLDRLIAIGLTLDLVLVFGPLRHSMRGAQTDIMLIAVTVLAWNLLQRQRWIFSGVLLGLAIVIKPTFVLLLGFHLWRRDWRSIGVVLATALLGTIVPFLLVSHQALTDFLRVSAFWAAPGFVMAPKSISLFGVFERACFTAPHAWSLCGSVPISRLIEALCVVGCYLGASALVPRRLGTADVAHWREAFGLIVLVQLLGSPLTEDAHLALALIPLGVLAAASGGPALRGARGAQISLGLAALIFLYLSFPAVRTAASFSTYAGWRVLLAGYWFYGLLALAIVYVWRGQRVRPFLGEDSALMAMWLDLTAAVRPFMLRLFLLSSKGPTDTHEP
jgi:hypothetical protein